MDFKNYSMEDLENIAIIPTYFRKNYIYNVEVTYIETPSRFFIRMAENSKFVKLINQISRSTLKKSLKYNVEDIVLYSEENDSETLRRGLILSKKPTVSRTLLPEFEYEIHAIDYGFVDHAIKRQTMWDCKIDVDPVAYECQLARCRPLKNTWDNITNVKFRRLLVGKQQLLIFCHRYFNNKFVVELFTQNYNVADFMIHKRWVKQDVVEAYMNKILI